MSRQSLGVAALWLGSLVVAAFGWASVIDSDRLLEIPGGQLIFVTFAVLAAPALATVINYRHPQEWTGFMLGLTMLLVAFGACRAASLEDFTAVAGPTTFVTALLPAVVIARYPALQIASRPARFVGASAAAAAVLGAIAAAIALADGAVPNPWWVSRRPAGASAWATGVLAAWVAVVGVSALVTAALVIRQFRTGPRHVRASLRPLVYPALGWTISVTATSIWTLMAGLRTPRLDFSGSNAGAAFGLLPAVLVGALAAGIGWLDLGVRRPERPSVNARVVAPMVQAYLARALADPSVRVAYPAGLGKVRLAEVAAWVDREGRIVEVDTDASDRAIAVIERDGLVIGLVEHDAATASRPDAVELVATGAGLIMETEWLTASANRDLETSRQLATRLLSAADEPRERLRDELVHGPLAELDAVTTALGRGARLADCLPELAAVSADLRAISHGLFPETLALGGLAETLPGVTSTARYPAVVELTAYLAAHDDPYATIVETGGRLCITTGSEPPVLVRDRVTALGGRVGAADARWLVEVPIAETPG